MNRVRWHRYFGTRVWSWICFIIGLGFMTGMWYLCYWVVLNHAPRYTLVYFKWGAWFALGLAAIMLVFNELIVKWSTGAFRIFECDTNSKMRKLWSAVAKVKPWWGMPRVYIIPTRSLNAISFGWGLPFMAAVGATQGLIDGLDSDELAAVMAHEIGHIYNKDMIVSMAMAITTMMMAATGWMLIRIGPYGAGGDSDSKKGSGLIALLVILAVGAVMYSFGRIFGVILQAFVSRQREYAADAISARIMGRGKPLSQALQKIVGGKPSIGSRAVGSAIGFLCTADPEPDDVIATHPSVSDRIQALAKLEQ